MSDSVRTIADGPEIELRVKGSRFAGQSWCVADDAAARERVSIVRRRYHDATHHCSAWRLGDPELSTARFDDDGEPAGTAGRPILSAIEGRALFDTVVVVTRWFGGTKLGTGGLARAYGEAAAAALDAARIVTRVLESTVEAEFGFEDVGAVETVIARAGEGVVRVERTFEPVPAVRMAVRRSRARDLAGELTEATAGRARVKIDGTST